VVRTLVSSSEDRGVIKSSILPRDEFVLSSPKFHSLATLSKWPVRFDVFDRKISNFILMVNKMANFKLDSEVKKKNKKKNSMITRHDCGKTKKF